MLMQFALITYILIFAIIVSNNSNNNNNSYEVKVEANIENDWVSENISRALDENSDFLLNQGFEKISNERNCYCSMLFTNDAGKIVLNQVCVPGGKKAQLSKANVRELLSNGIVIGKEKDNFVVCVENSAWWGDIALKMLSEYPSLNCKDGLMYIIIIDNLTKHQGSDVVDKLQQICKAVGFGAAKHTHNVQANDLGVNGVIDVGVKSYSNKFILTFGNGKVPSWAQLCLLQYKITQIINNSPTYEQMIIKNHSTGGYTLPIDNDEQDHKFLDGLQLKPPHAYLNQYFNDEIIKATAPYGQPWHAPAKLLKQLKRVTGPKTTPPGHIKWKPTKKEMRYYMDEYDRAQSGKIIFDTDSKKSWLNQRRKQVGLYYEALITNNPKYNQLNQEGLIEKREEICTDGRLLVAATAATKQKLRKEKLNQRAAEMMEKESNPTREYAEGGQSLSHLFHTVAMRQKYLNKQIQTRGIWSAQKGGKVNKSKTNSINTQPLINDAFAIVKINNQKKLIEQQKQQLLLDAMERRNAMQRKSNKKSKKRNKKRKRSESMPPSPKKSTKKIKKSKTSKSDKTEMSDCDEQDEKDDEKKDEKHDKNENDKAKRSISAPPKKGLTSAWANFYAKQSKNKNKNKK